MRIVPIETGWRSGLSSSTKPRSLDHIADTGEGWFPVGDAAPNFGAKMVPLYAARIEDLGPGDFVKVYCAACNHTALLARTFLTRFGLGPRDKVLDLQGRARCRGCGARGRAVVSIKWAKPVA
jgi:hypothetical protein